MDWKVDRNPFDVGNEITCILKTSASELKSAIPSFSLLRSGMILFSVVAGDEYFDDELSVSRVNNPGQIGTRRNGFYAWHQPVFSMYYEQVNFRVLLIC